MHTLVCAECNEPFQHNRKGRKTCSDICYKRRRSNSANNVIKAKKTKDPDHYKKYTHVCSVCSESFKSRYKDSMCCSRDCARTLAVKASAANRPESDKPRISHLYICTCTVCGFVGAYRYRVARCSDACKLEHKRDKNRRSDHRRRAAKYAVQIEPIYRREVYDSYDWVCQLCFKPIDKTLQYPDPMSVSLDHRVPLAKGGSHTMANCQPAHFICNSIKSDQIDFVIATAS